MPTLPTTFNPNLSIEPYRGAGHATARGASMPIPAAAMLAMSLGGGFLQNFFGGRSRRKEQEAAQQHQMRLATMDDTRARDMAALEESELDPFRHVLNQIAAAAMADRLAKTEPLRQAGSRSIGGYSVPDFEGGVMSYDADPELRAAADAMRSLVLSGEGQAPTVMRSSTATPNLRGPNPQTGAQNLLRPPVSTTMPVGRPQPMAPPPGAATGLTVMDERGARPDDFRLSIEDVIAPPAPVARRPARRGPRRYAA